MKYTVRFKEVQRWDYEYHIEADTQAEAEAIADAKWADGTEADSSYLQDGVTVKRETEEY